MVQGQVRVVMVQGQAYFYELEFSGDTASVVTKVVISSDRFNFCHELERNANEPNKWSYLFTEQETLGFDAVDGTHSITIYSSVEELNPQILPNQLFSVCKNQNPQTCEV